MARQLRQHWLELVVYLGALVPLAILGWNFQRGVYFDPVGALLTWTGRAATVMLFLTLSVSPLHAVTGWGRVLRLRRGLGLYTFLYAAVHFLVFAGLDYGFGLDFLLPAIANQLFVLAGMGAFLLLLLLAITSTRGWQRRLGKRWKQLQRLVYLATIVDVVHVVWARKALLEAWPYFTVATLLLLLRLPPARRALARLRKGEEA